MSERLIAGPHFTLDEATKTALLLPELNALVAHHRACCPAYARILDALDAGHRPAETLAELPFLPASLFKTHDLRSIPDDAVSTIMTSSGTTGQAVSRIALDRDTAALQARALAAVLATELGRQRMPMLIVDSRASIRDPRLLSARGAGIVGFMRFGRDHVFLLDDDMRPDRAALGRFLDACAGRPFLIFGFTFMVWQALYAAVASGGIDLSRGTLIHSGGWKKLAEVAVDNGTFRTRLGEASGLTRIFNFYGMVEQMGTVFLEGADGLLYPPDFADVIIRDPATLAPLPLGETGLIQVLSLLPRSYPGHSLLTEDLGAIRAVDGARRGRGLAVTGRAPRSELRGCSDTYAYKSRAA